MTTTVTEDERDRLYAMAREAQLRDIKPLAVKPEKSELEGVKTNVALHGAIVADPDFREGGVDTNYLAGLLPGLITEEDAA